MCDELSCAFADMPSLPLPRFPTHAGCRRRFSLTCSHAKQPPSHNRFGLVGQHDCGAPGRRRFTPAPNTNLSAERERPHALNLLRYTLMLPRHPNIALNQCGSSCYHSNGLARFLCGARDLFVAGGIIAETLTKAKQYSLLANPRGGWWHTTDFRLARNKDHNLRDSDPISGCSFLSAACLSFGPVCVRTRTGRRRQVPAQAGEFEGHIPYLPKNYGMRPRNFLTSSVAASLVVASSVGPASSWVAPDFFAASKLPPGTSDIQIGQEHPTIGQDPERRS